MQFTSEQRLDDGVLEREFTLGEIPGILWTPGSASAPAPLILLGHPGGLRKMYPRLAARARHSAAEGFAAATIELPGSGDRPPFAAAEQARADLRRALAAGEPVDDEIVDRLVLPLVEKAVPEWQAALDALLALPEIGGPVGYSGGVIAIGIRLAVVEPRIVGRRSVRRELRAPQPCSTRPGRSPFRCMSCCSGTTKGTTGRWPWTCSTPSAPRRRRCTPTWAGTPASRSSQARRRGPVLRPAPEVRPENVTPARASPNACEPPDGSPNPSAHAAIRARVGVRACDVTPPIYRLFEGA